MNTDYQSKQVEQVEAVEVIEQFEQEECECDCCKGECDCEYQFEQGECDCEVCQDEQDEQDDFEEHVRMENLWMEYWRTHPYGDGYGFHYWLNDPEEGHTWKGNFSTNR